MVGRSAKLLGVLCVLSATPARAGNGVHPRTPVLWEPAPACMTIVDRSQSAQLELTYTIPYEDLRPMDAIDEVDTSRRHQFLAFCRGHSVQEPLPVWLSMADAVDAGTKDLVDPMALEPDEVLDTSPEWMDCLHRITPDDARRLITKASAAEPVVWDTSTLPVGPYVVSGYTWEPAFNIYSTRPGVVKVIDDPDPAASPPALAVGNMLGEEIVWETELLTIYGCVSAMDGSTLTGYWANTDTEGQPLVWTAFESDVPVSGDAFELVFDPPSETAGKTLAIKVDVVDPMDRSFTGHMNLLASVLIGSPPTSDSEGESDSDACGMGFIMDPNCGSSGGVGSSSAGDETASEGQHTTGAASEPTTGGGGSSGEGGTTGPMVEPGAKDGCAGCSVGAPGSSLAWLALGLLVRRRRR